MLSSTNPKPNLYTNAKKMALEDQVTTDNQSIILSHKQITEIPVREALLATWIVKNQTWQLVECPPSITFYLAVSFIQVGHNLQKEAWLFKNQP